MLRLHDTATGQVRELALREAGKVTMYVCGPTVDYLPHIGHGRFVLVFDVLRRYLEWAGFEVNYVSNITDIDDKIITRANDEGRAPAEVAATYEEAWWRGLDALGVARPTADPHATDYVGEMVAMVEELVDRDLAYETSDGVYLDTSQVEGYGLLARQPLDSLRAGASERVDANDEKRSPLDFALWKKVKPGEPSWASPWGPGRPGWHTECVVMSLGLLGEGFDIHGGGQDLMFPHHENERAQAVALGKRFATHWVHNGWVMSEGEKMSKSLGNTKTIDSLLETYDRRAYRLLCLQAHYRSPIQVTVDTLERATTSMGRLDEFARRTAALAGEPETSLLDQFRDAMDDDLDTPKAMALLFTAVRDGNTALASGDPARAAGLAAAVREMALAVGLDLTVEVDEVDAATGALVAERDRARSDRDFAAADAARDQLMARGWVVEDTPDGTRVRRS